MRSRRYRRRGEHLVTCNDRLHRETGDYDATIGMFHLEVTPLSMNLDETQPRKGREPLFA